MYAWGVCVYVGKIIVITVLVFVVVIEIMFNTSPGIHTRQLVAFGLWKLSIVVV